MNGTHTYSACTILSVNYVIERSGQVTKALKMSMCSFAYHENSVIYLEGKFV